MTVLDGLRQLFSAYPFQGKDLVWLVDEIVRVVQHTGSVTIECVRTDGGEFAGVVCRTPDDEYRLPISRVGVFRSILARFGVMCSDETGTEFQPYGGRYVLTRSSHSGPVRLEIEFTNTTAPQRLSITRTPLPRVLPVHSGNGAAPPPKPAEPAGA